MFIAGTATSGNEGNPSSLPWILHAPAFIHPVAVMTRRDIWLVVTSLALGPALGALGFMLAVIVTDATASPTRPNMPGGLAFVVDYWPVILSAGYILGAIPGLASAVIMSLLTRALPRRAHRLIAAPLVGAVVSIAILSFVLFGGRGPTLGDLMMIVSVLFAGAVAGFGCLAVIERFHPWPPVPKAII